MMRNRELIGKPHDLAAEKNVIGSMLLSPEACDLMSLTLRDDDFYDQAHACLFRHMLAIHDRGQPLDETLLVRQMKKAGDLGTGADGEPPKLCTMLQMYDAVHSVPSASSAEYYAGIVRETSIQRAMVTAAEQIAKEAQDFDGGAIDQLLGSVEQRILAIGERRMANAAVPIADVIQVALAEFDRRRTSSTPAGLRTGLHALDSIIGGLRDGELVILAARPSMGKTALASAIADHLGVRCASPVLFFSLEMGRLALAERIMAARGGVSLTHMRQGSMNEAESRALVEVSAELSQGQLYIDDAGEQTISAIGATARRMKRRSGLSLVIVDYLQLIVPDNSRDNREQQVATMTRRLKQLARELSVPVLCLAQLNRDVEKRADKKPILPDLRESGAIEQDADIVMFVHRPGYYDTEAPAEKAVVSVAKNRNGPTGDAAIKWEAAFTRFTNQVEEWDF